MIPEYPALQDKATKVWTLVAIDLCIEELPKYRGYQQEAVFRLTSRDK